MRLLDMTLDTLASTLFTALRVTGSIIDGPHSAVLVDGKGVGGFNPNDDADGGETLTAVEAYGAPGIVWMPRPPEVVNGEEISVEAFGVRTADGPQPLSWRDLRWHRSYPAPKPGSKAFVGDAGGFLDFRDVETIVGGKTVQNQAFSLYVPYGKNPSGVPQKAMAISVDPEAESLMLIHGDGYAVVMDKDNGIVNRSKTGSSWTSLKDDKFEVVAEQIVMRGTCTLGVNTVGALPLLPGPASQPTPSVFFSAT